MFTLIPILTLSYTCLSEAGCVCVCVLFGVVSSWSLHRVKEDSSQGVQSLGSCQCALHHLELVSFPYVETAEASFKDAADTLFLLTRSLKTPKPSTLNPQAPVTTPVVEFCSATQDGAARVIQPLGFQLAPLRAVLPMRAPD